MLMNCNAYKSRNVTAMSLITYLLIKMHCKNTYTGLVITYMLLKMYAQRRHKIKNYLHDDEHAYMKPQCKL